MFPSRIASVLGGGVGLPNNYSLAFDSSDDYVSVGTSIDAGTTSTFSLWIKRDDPTNNATSLLGEDDNASDYLLYINKHYGLYVRTGSHAYLYEDSATTTAINTTDWIHIAVVRETVTGKVYINAVLVQTEVDDGSGNAWSANTTFDTIGAKPDGSGAFGGNIDEVAVWNTALSAGDISALYQAKGTSNLNDDGNSANLKGWWRMGDGVLDSHPLIADQVNPTLGVEEFGTADNDWNVTSAYWSISSGVLTFNGEVNGNAYHAGTTIGAFAFATGTTYKLQLTIANSGDDARLIFQDSDNNAIIANATYPDGIHTFYFTAVSDNNGETPVIRGVSAGSSFDITSYSLKQVNGNPGLMTNMATDDIVKDTP